MVQEKLVLETLRETLTNFLLVSVFIVTER